MSKIFDDNAKETIIYELYEAFTTNSDKEKVYYLTERLIQTQQITAFKEKYLDGPLYCATKYNYIDSAKLLYESSKINDRCKKNSLLEAVINISVDMVQYLLEKQVDPNYVDSWNISVIEASIVNLDTENMSDDTKTIVQLLVDYGADISDHLLDISIKIKKVSVLKWLHSIGVIDTVSHDIIWSTIRKLFDIIADTHEKFDIIEFYIENINNSFDITDRDQKMIDLLVSWDEYYTLYITDYTSDDEYMYKKYGLRDSTEYLLCKQEVAKLYKKLCKKMINIGIITYDIVKSSEALDHALYIGNYDMYRIIVKNMPKLVLETKDALLMVADFIDKNYPYQADNIIKIIKSLISLGIDVNYENDNYTAVIIAFQNEYYDIVKLLLDNGANNTINLDLFC